MPKKIKTAPVSLAMQVKLDSVRTCAFDQGANERDTIAAIKSAGISQDTTRNAFIIGRMASALMTNAEMSAGDNERTSAMVARFEQAANALDKSGATSKKKAKARRTAAEEKAYGAARVAWVRILSAAGVTSEGKNAKNKNAKRQPKTGANKAEVKGADTAPILIEQLTPTAPKASDVTRHLETVAKGLGTFHLKNAKSFEVWQVNAVNDFIKAIKAGKPEAKELQADK